MSSSSRSRLRDAVKLSCVLVVLASCGGGGGGGGGSSGPPASKLFFADGGNRAIVSTSNAAPTTSLSIDRIVEGTHTLLGPVPGDILSIPSIMLDAANDRLYVATQGNTLIYNNISTADGDVAPSLIMSAVIDTGSGSRGVSFFYNDLDRTHGVLYSVDFSGEVHVFNNPLTAPSVVSRIISPALGAAVSSSSGLAIDVAHDMLYACLFSGGEKIIAFNNASTIGTAIPNTFPPTPTTVTPVTPDRTLSFANSVGSFYLDTVNDRLYVAQSTGVVLVFDNASALATGTPTPNRTIDVTNGTAVQLYIFVDKTRNKLYAVASNTPSQLGILAVIDNASTANGVVGTTATGVFFSFSPVANIALSAIAVAP